LTHLEGITPVRWTELSRLGGVRLLATGEGPPVVVLSGLEGSGESCLHLVLPVVVPAGASPRGRVILVDYAAEQHRLLAELVDTIGKLLSRTLPGETVTLWGQSFGNLLAALIAQNGSVSVQRSVLVSPFTALPQARVAVARVALAVAWRPIYRVTARPVSKFVFGPAPGHFGDSFFRAISREAPSDVRRRVGWLARTDFASAFLALPAPAGVWLGERDRLIDLSRQLAFFARLTLAPGSRLTVIPGSGHVVLPPDAVSYTRATVADWLGGAVPLAPS
jgi:pimeloyl-ACP methyl ester carboxylesterase